MSTTLSMTNSGSGLTPLALYQRAVRLAERIPMSFVQLASRVAVGYVFWNSAQSKFASWPITIQLFRMEYQVPVLPSELAATLATATELTGAILLFIGLFTRLSALALLGLVAVIQFLVYPGHWGEHLLWASLLLLLLARGAGVISLDCLAKRFFVRNM
jgi:putative oxidoreductase